MDYAAGLQYLSQLRRLGIVPGTERLADVLHRLGSPQAQVPAIHIAGTNGKGSTAAFAAHLLATAAQTHAHQTGTGLARVGLYTSPHLCRVRERIRIGPSPAAVAGSSLPSLPECSEPDFARALSAVRAACEAAPAVELTFFEVLTAAAFLIFAEAAVQVAVIETGLGGRLDATRLCQAQVTVVTGIGLDHTELLGDTLPAIAYEKAGIFRPQVPALVCCDDAGALAVLGSAAQAQRAPLFVLAGPGQAMVPPGSTGLPTLPTDLAAILPLPGEHQRRNAALALAAVLRMPGPLGQVAHDRAVQAQGLAATTWPGRLERLWPHPQIREAELRARLSLPDDVALPEVWLDGAHNAQGADLLAQFVDGLPEQRPLSVLFGVVADKALPGMLSPLRRAQRCVLTEPPSPRALPSTELAARLTDLLCPAPLSPSFAPSMELQPSLHVQAALPKALRDVIWRAGGSGRLLIYGSLFLVGAVRALWFGEPCDSLAVSDPGPRR